MMKQKPTIIYENTVAGSFVRRINRFTAEVLIDGETELVHVKNTGRFAGASGAESEGDAAEDVEYESKNGIRSDLCIQAKAKMGEY